jgi:hypothetical protein
MDLAGKDIERQRVKGTVVPEALGDVSDRKGGSRPGR